MKKDLLKLFLTLFVVLFGGIVIGLWGIEWVHAFIMGMIIAVFLVTGIAYSMGIKEVEW